MPAPQDVDRLCEQLAFQSRVLTAVLCKLDALCCCLQQRAAPAAGGPALPPVPAAAPVAFAPAASPQYMAAQTVGRPAISRAVIMVPTGTPTLVAVADPGRTFLSFANGLGTAFTFDTEPAVDGGMASYQFDAATGRLDLSRDTHGGLITAAWYGRHVGGADAVLYVWTSVG